MIHVRSRPATSVVQMRYPYAYERQYRAYMERLLVDIRRAVFQYLAPAYSAELAMRNAVVRRDAMADWVTGALHAIRLTITDRLVAGQRLAVDLSASISAFAKRPWQVLAEKQVGVNIFRTETWLEPLLRSWAEANAELIKSIPDRYLADVAQAAQDMIRQGRSTKDFTERLTRTYGIQERRAKVIARTEVAKLNGQISKARQQSLGVEEYVWSTSGDERVRPSHKMLNGKICRYDDPTVYRNEGETEWRKRSGLGAYVGDPGEDVQCRCISSARISQLIDHLLK